MSRARVRESRRAAPESDATSSWRLLLALVMNLLTVLRLLFQETRFASDFSHAAQWTLMLATLVLVWFSVPRRETVQTHLRSIFRTEFVVALAGVLLGWWWTPLGIAAALLLLAHAWTAYLWLLGRGLNPGVIFAGSFVVLILFGALALKLPESTPDGKPISWVDAIFTSTSAACVTGLVVRDTGTEFTRFGQSVILGLIQLGGLGTTLFGALVALPFGSSISLKAVHAMADSTPSGSASPRAMRRLLVFAAGVVFGIELIGALLLYIGWPATWPGAPVDIENPADRAFHAVFFAVSAFCNAGFATALNNTSLEGLRVHWTSHFVVAGLIVVGGIGLPVLANLSQIVWAKLRARPGRGRGMLIGGSLVRLSLHTKLVLTMTTLLYLVGFLGIFLSQWLQRDVPVAVAALDAHFMSISARTAGFDTVVPAEMGAFARFTLMLSMFVGGSPGSAAGGVKTIAFAVLLITVWLTVVGRDSTESYGRRIAEDVIRKAIVLFMLHVITILVVVGALVITEQGRFTPITDVGPFESYVFEAISGCSTVGLSLGVTFGLSDEGKLVLSLGMFLGRVGSLAFLVAVAAGLARRAAIRYSYPAEGVVLS